MRLFLSKTRAAVSLLNGAFVRAGHRLTRRIVAGYIGWIGHGNLGDEAMFAAIQSLLKGCALVPYLSLRKKTLLSRIGLSGESFFDCFVVGGGTLVNPGFWPPVSTAARAGLPLVMFGTGVGSSGYGQPEQVEIAPWASLADQFIAVGVRGPLSRKALEDLGFTNVEVIGDPAPSLTTLAPSPTPRRPRLVVSLGGPLPPLALNALVSMVREFDTMGIEVIGAALGSGDKERLAQLFATAGRRDLPIISTRRNAEAYFRLIQGSMAVLAGRLHAAVLACCAGVPPIILGYRSKCSDFAASMEVESHVVPLNGQSQARLREVWQTIEAGGDRLCAHIQERARTWHGRQCRFAAKVLGELKAHSDARLATVKHCAERKIWRSAN